MKTSLALLLSLTLTASLFAEAPQPGTDLRKTLTAASQQQKLAFILLGRPTCGNCNATKAMIREGKIGVTAADFVMADLNIDDPKTEAEFTRKFRKEQFGETLPFVVITDGQGKALASSGGYKGAAQWEALLAEAKAKAGKTAAVGGKTTGAATTGANWPFKTPAKP